MKSTYIVTPNFPPDICGIGDYSSYLFHNLRKNNVDVNIITFSDNPNKTSDRIHLIKLADKKRVSSWLNCLKSKNEVNTVLIQYEPYSFSKIGVPLYLVYICLRLRLKGYKLSIMFHEVATRLYIANLKKIGISLLQLFIAYTLTALSSVRTTSTTFNARQLKPFKFKFLPISSNFTKNNSIITPDTDKLKIGCFANRVDDFFASVIVKILEKKLGVIYLIGKQSKANNETWEKYNLYDRSDLIITGTLSAEEIESCFNNLNMFIHMEKIDNKGRGGASLKNGSLAAALNWGLPVITSKGDMTDESLLKNKVNILFVSNPHNTTDWVNAVELLITNVSLKSSIQENAASFYDQNLSWPIITQKYISLIEPEPV